MSPVPVSPRRVFGVDFSAARDAGRRIWVCRAHPGAGGVRIESVAPLCELPGAALSRKDAMRSLVQKVVESPRSAWGFDFSFGLPKPVLEALAPGVSGFAAQADLVAGFDEAETLRARCLDAFPTEELRRRTDDESSTPFSPYNVRIFKQTFHGVADVLRPLHKRPEVAVLPFDGIAQPDSSSAPRLAFNRAASGKSAHIYLMEVCPASVLVALGESNRGYKGSASAAGQRRRAILGRLTGDELIRPMARSLRRRIVDDDGGDALDAVLAAVGAWRGYRTYDHAALHADPLYRVEGFVYT